MALLLAKKLGCKHNTCKLSDEFLGNPLLAWETTTAAISVSERHQLGLRAIRQPSRACCSSSCASAKRPLAQRRYPPLSLPHLAARIGLCSSADYVARPLDQLAEDLGNARVVDSGRSAIERIHRAGLQIGYHYSLGAPHAIPARLLLPAPAACSGLHKPLRQASARLCTCLCCSVDQVAIVSRACPLCLRDQLARILVA